MNLTTSYMGIELRNPLVAAASPLSNTMAGLRQLADAGVGAVVLYSLFEEQLLDHDERSAISEDDGPRRYLSLLESAAADLDVPLIASLNGTSPGGWTDYAIALEKAGAAAIELNVYHPLGNPPIPARDVERRLVEVLTTVKAVVGVPVAVKLHPYFSSMAEMAERLDAAGANGLVLFNRFLQPDIDPETLTVTADFGLSTPHEARLPRAWIALLAGRLHASLAASTGVEDALDVAKYLLAGADVVMTASALIRHGPMYTRALLDGLSAWMSAKGFTELSQVRGLLSVPLADDESARARAGYVTVLRAADLGSGPW